MILSPVPGIAGAPATLLFRAKRPLPFAEPLCRREV
jgi:hypothetical protein